MIDKETKYKAECIYSNLSETALRIVDKFTKTLEISEEDAYKLITSNVNAITFLIFESSLKLYGDEKSMQILMTATLLRKGDYDKPITDDEMNKIKEYYGFIVKRLSASAL